ncbi:pilus assembly FimT family protein [Dyella acidisoli]|uniref:Prepilin-type N-terminal cleavage/methylation domain-containing protein n=1 Tax=Dyella acidisoli TaxID=1867834 RepID=A0ABQ5XHR9_9GAMM|nr:prepilin-type N-terminal cleavage/methylation domain-containing protein [Dyella acidisoli]GLQ91229.1 hypothetical protein GCM10007901_01790 [Dyella acidisoli]
MTTSGQRGVSLIELMVTVTILAILLVLGIPSFQQWTLNTRIRTVSESIQNGLRLARNEAAQQAAYVRFQLNSAGNWQVCVLPSSSASASDCSNASSVVQTWNSTDVGSSVQVGASTAVNNVAAGTFGNATITGGVPAGITFNALGRPTAYGSSSVLRIDVTAAQASMQATSRRLVTLISTGGMVNMCDPAFLMKNNPMGCP